MNAPYYIIPTIEAFKAASGAEKAVLARKISVAIGNLPALRKVLGMDPSEFATFYPDMSTLTPTTADTIDTFIDNYSPHQVHSADELDDIIQPVAVPYNLEDIAPDQQSSDDALYNDNSDDDTFALLNSFLGNTPASKPAPAQREPKPAPVQRPVASEALAKNYIKNGDYQKAIEIITELNLKNPKKSVYFADQIRFLKTLIALKQQ